MISRAPIVALLADKSPADLARAAGVTRQVAFEWIRGIRRIPPARLDAVAAFLGVTPQELHHRAAREAGFKI